MFKLLAFNTPVGLLADFLPTCANIYTVQSCVSVRVVGPWRIIILLKSFQVVGITIFQILKLLFSGHLPRASVCISCLSSSR